MYTEKPIDKLLNIMAQLRDPQSGCPWDIKQTFQTIAPHTLEEAYEVVDAIEKNDLLALKEELGDLLLQVIFHAQMATEANLFNFDQVVEAITEKLIKRHPHVFGDTKIHTAEEQTIAWESYKAEERKQAKQSSVLDSITQSLPGLIKATKLQDRAAQVGFDWPSIQHVFSKLAEEIEELKVEIEQKASAERLLDELGDILFVCANIGRHLKIDSEVALRHANQKFEHRFRQVEKLLAEAGKTPQESNLEEMDKLWAQVKNAINIK